MTLTLIAAISVYCMHLLIQVKQSLAKQHHRDYLSYGDVAELVLGPAGRIMINIFLLITQLGFCCVYVVFISEHLHEIVETIAVLEFMLILLPLLIMLSFIKSIKILAATSMGANLLLAYSIVVIFVYVSNNFTTRDQLPFDSACSDSFNGTIPLDGLFPAICLRVPSPRAFTGWADMPIFFGNSIYAFEGIGLILPMENMMHEPRRFGTVVNVGMSIMAVLYVSFGYCGYWLFGGATLVCTDDASSLCFAHITYMKARGLIGIFLFL